MTQTTPATHPAAITVNFEAIMEASIHIPRSGTLRVPATPLRVLPRGHKPEITHDIEVPQ